MAKQIKSRRVSRAKQNTFQVRQLWLAAMGAVSLGRKQSVKLYASVIAEGRGLQDRLNETVADLSGQVNLVIAEARNRAEALVSPLRARAEATFANVKSEVESRLQPVLAKFGVLPKTAKRRATKTTARKPVAKKAVAKRAPAKRKAA